MTSQMEQYKQQLEKQLSIVCGNAVGAYFDTYMFMCPDAFPHLRSNTYLFLYSYYAIRNRTILSVKKLIEPSYKNKINLDSIVKIITQSDCMYLPDKEKQGLTEWFNNVQKCDSAIRLKRFRDAISHNLPDGDEAMIIYNDLMHTMNDVIDILERLYYVVFNTDKLFYCFNEVKYIARILSSDYWIAVSNMAKTMPNQKNELARLSQLLQGKFGGQGGT